jgi:hypothetical protein
MIIFVKGSHSLQLFMAKKHSLSNYWKDNGPSVNEHTAGNPSIHKNLTRFLKNVLDIIKVDTFVEKIFNFVKEPHNCGTFYIVEISPKLVLQYPWCRDIELRDSIYCRRILNAPVFVHARCLCLNVWLFLEINKAVPCE